MVCTLNSEQGVILATFHLSVKTVSRTTGRSAVAAAAYRAGERLTNAGDRVVHDYSRRGGVAAAVLLVPDGAGGLAAMEGRGWTAERERLWNAAEAAETRKNSTVAREYELALPDELDEGGRRELAVGFAREVASRFGVAADVAVHAPSREGDQRNHHAHVLTTTRRVEAGGALGAKTRELDDKKTGPAHVEALRELWAIQVNVALERIQAEARVDHRSHERRGLAAIPGIRMGAGATAMERREQERHGERDGEPDVAPPVTRRGQRQDEIAAMNAAAEERRAEAEWVARRRQEAEERERRAEARRELERQAEAARVARMAVQASQEPVEVPLASPWALDAPHPVQTPQRPLEAAQGAAPNQERRRSMPQGELRPKPEVAERPTRAVLAAMVRQARGEFLDEREAEESEREWLAAMARMEAEHQAQQARRAEAERVSREREEQARAEAQRAGAARAAAVRPTTGSLFQTSPAPFELPSPDEVAWTTRRKQLVQERRLSERVVDGLKGLGRLIPRQHGFLLAMRDRWGAIVGAELYDDFGFHPFLRSRLDLGGVWLSRGTPGRPRDVFLVETGLDALSLHELVRFDPARQQVFVSAAGARSRVAWLHELLERGSRLFVAYKADPASEDAAQAIMAQYPTVSARRVPKGADWNAHLVAVREAEDRREVQASIRAAQEHDDGDGLDWWDEWQPR